MTSTPLDRAIARVEAGAPAAAGVAEGPPAAPPPTETLAPALLTLGFYRFWGRTRIRRYLWSRLTLLEDRFEYDGTGMELFVRFLLVVAVVLLPLGAVGLILRFAGLPLPAVIAGRYAVFLVIFYLSLVGHYTGQRYRLSRSLWRGI